MVENSMTPSITEEQITKLFENFGARIRKKKHLLSKDDVQKALMQPELVHELFATLLKRVQAVESGSVHEIDCDAEPFVPKGYSVSLHRKGGTLYWDRTKVYLYLSEDQKKPERDHAYHLYEKFKGLAVLNSCYLSYLLAHPHLIPEEWKGKNVYFWGTIYEKAGNHLYVRYLYWNDGQWLWGIRGMDGYPAIFDESEPAVLYEA